MTLYFFASIVFGFVQSEIVEMERAEPYEAQLAFLSGRSVFGGFRIFINYNAGTASE